MSEESIFNPFLADKPAHEYFVGREEELKELRRYLGQARSGRPSNLYIVGGGGDGKTSFLIKAVEEAEQQGLLAVFLNVDPATTPFELVILLMESVLEVIIRKSDEPEYLRDFKRVAGTPSHYFKTPNGQDIVTKYLKDDFQTLLELCEGVGISAVVLCLDEGQNLRTINGHLLASLRGAIQELGRGFMIILSSLEDIMPELSLRYVGVDRFFPNRLTLGAFDNDDEALSCISRRLQDRPIEFDSSAKNLIVRISGRHPREIIDISHRAFNDAIDSGANTVTVSMVDSVIYVKYYDKIMWLEQTLGKLQPNEKDTLNDLVRMGGKTTITEMAAALCSDKQDLYGRLISALKTDLSGLCEHGICRRVLEPENSEIEEQYEVIDPMSVYILEGLLEVR